MLAGFFARRVSALANFVIRMIMRRMNETFQCKRMEIDKHW